MNDILRYTRERSPELAESLIQVSAWPLRFEGDDPLFHSYENHVHLHGLGCITDPQSWIDTTYKVEFIKYILEQWRLRLKGLSPYRNRGYRLYVYEDVYPTVSVVAETDVGFPYRHRQAVFVPNIIDVVRLYEVDDSRRIDTGISGRKILEAVERHKGSIGKPTANALGIQVGKLRTLITEMFLYGAVNKIRKKYGRRPADFSNEPKDSYVWHVFERVLPANYE
jgi:hypothetical protein